MTRIGKYFVIFFQDKLDIPTMFEQSKLMIHFFMEGFLGYPYPPSPTEEVGVHADFSKIIMLLTEHTMLELDEDPFSVFQILFEKLLEELQAIQMITPSPEIQHAIDLIMQTHGMPM
jgi:hypothetical protein